MLARLNAGLEHAYISLHSEHSWLVRALEHRVDACIDFILERFADITMQANIRNVAQLRRFNNCLQESTTVHIDDDEVGIELASAIAAFEAKEFRRAMQLMSPLAELGVADAQFRMAVMYQNGLGIVADGHRAYQWMSAAAEQDFALAQHGLGFMFAHGEGVPRDGMQAVKWLERGAEQGLIGSMATLAELYVRGELVGRDVAKARGWYERAGFDPDEFLDAED